ncbi:MAG: hypothetical protein J1F35_06170 [Erysipelotrichales bacterium]|nr:hypothetical protein [Erysipelotrichales bacterium]
MKSLLENIKEYCEPCQDSCACDPSCSDCRDRQTPCSAQYAATLKQSISDMWTEHLDTHNYVVHMALDDYYQKAPKPIDGIIEALKACPDTTFNMNGAGSLVCYQNWVGNPGGYLGEIRSKMYEARDGIWEGYHEIESMCDDLDKIIAEALYKINVLSKGLDSCPSLSDYVNNGTPCPPVATELEIVQK